jgi:hypothetical protein
MSIFQGQNMIAGSGGGGIANYDGKSITENSMEEIQTIGVINSRDSSTAIKTWTGTRAQYDDIVTKDQNTLYNITDDTDVSLTILEALYPVGSVYITTADTCPLSTLISGSTWTQETCRQLVEKKEPTDNDPSWYNLYSDGWCEQGGKVSITTLNQSITVNLLKPFKDTNYTAMTCKDINSTGNSYSIGVNIISGSILNIINNGGIVAPQMWQACGYTSTTTSHKQFRRTA